MGTNAGIGVEQARGSGPARVLFVCTHNSARSVLAEGMLNHWAERLGRPVRAHSAGSADVSRYRPAACWGGSGP